nr:MAG TPA: hypothetical protein [Caudoviricetes sp.]
MWKTTLSKQNRVYYSYYLLVGSRSNTIMLFKEP